jgi:hypothetical protein
MRFSAEPKALKTGAVVRNDLVAGTVSSSPGRGPRLWMGEVR